MTFRLYLIGFALATLIALLSFCLIIIFFSPENADAFLLSLLFLSLFIAFSGLFSLAGFFIRKKRNRREASFKFLSISFRQGISLAILLTASLVMRTYNIFWWWGGVILILIVLGVEFLFLRRQN
ncbi:MAG: hypothetical protein HY764_04760 [Candidatus Portnoybacteria bacterium]|nr:hypothetical protein [Candidatus Portnoybacteria bacterium]